MKSFILIYCSLFSLICAQVKRELIIMAGNDSVFLYISIPPRSTEGLNVFRKGPLPAQTEFIQLNTKGPVTPVIDPAEAQAIIGNDWDDVTRALRSDDPYDALRKLRGTEFTGGLISLMYPSAAKVSGRLFIDSTAETGKEYEYKIFIVNSSGKPVDSLLQRTIINPVYPVPPSNLKTEELDQNLKLTWAYPKWNDQQDNLAVKFFVYRKTGTEPFQKINNKTILRDNAAEPEYTDVWLQNGQEYSYYVTAVDPVGRESKPSPVIKAVPKDKMPPSIPNIFSSYSSGGKVVLNWKISLEQDAAGYNVFRSNGLDKEFKKLNKTMIPVDKTQYIDSTGLKGVQYFYSVSALDKNMNESDHSNAVYVIAKDLDKPEPPANVTFTLNKNIVLLNWKKSPSKDLSGYYVTRGNSKENQARISGEIIRNTTYADSGYMKTGYQPGKIYISVSAVDSSFNESEKVFVLVNIPDNDPPLPPNNFFVENSEGRFITINPGSSISQDVKHYSIYKAEGGHQAKIITPNETISDQLFDSVLTKGKQYIYYATAVDTAGNESIPGIADTILFRDYSPPPSVSNLVIRPADNGAQIEWEKVMDFDLDGYYVLRSEIPNGIYEKLNKIPLKETVYTDISGSNKYYYKVVSVDTSGNLSDAEDFVYLP